MSRPHPGLPVTAAMRAHRKAACCVAAAVCGLGLLAVPYGRIPLGESVTFLPAFGALTAFADALTAVLLFNQAQALSDRQLGHLSTAYLVSFVAIVFHMLAFPGAVTGTGVIGTSSSAVWLWCVWHAGFAICVCRYAMTKPVPAPRSQRLRMAGSVIVVLGLVVLATLGQAMLPTILVDGRFGRLNTLGVGPFVVLCNLVALAVVLARLRCRTVLATWLAVAMLAALVDVVLTLFGGARFTIGWYAARCLSLATGMIVLVALLSELMSLFRQSEAANRQLQILSHTDGLTGIPNRRSFDETLADEWRRGAREQTALCLLIMDIDFFKSYNDRYGHPAGDECLRQVARAISGVTRRAGDVVARIGGEEFAILLPIIEEDGAAEVASRVHAAVSSLAIVHEASPSGRVSISVGVGAAYPSLARASSELVKAVDLALYRAKQTGRNRTVRAGSILMPGQQPCVVPPVSHPSLDHTSQIADKGIAAVNAPG